MACLLFVFAFYLFTVLIVIWLMLFQSISYVRFTSMIVVITEAFGSIPTHLLSHNMPSPLSLSLRVTVITCKPHPAWLTDTEISSVTLVVFQCFNTFGAFYVGIRIWPVKILVQFWKFFCMLWTWKVDVCMLCWLVHWISQSDEE